MVNKKAQVTIFIIVGIFIVIAAVLLYVFWPKISPAVSGKSSSPQTFVQECIEEELNEKINLISSQGGSFNPEFYFVYEGGKVEYLCYTSAYYFPCVMQQPMLKRHVETEIKEKTEQGINQCLENMRKNFEDKGYSVSVNKKNYEIELLPKKIIGKIDVDVTLTKEKTESFDSMSIVLNNNLYELISIASSILNSEARYGDSETTEYMSYYPWLKVEKKKQTDGTTIYILTERKNENKFQFASRSVVVPGGY